MKMVSACISCWTWMLISSASSSPSGIVFRGPLVSQLPSENRWTGSTVTYGAATPCSVWIATEITR